MMKIKATTRDTTIFKAENLKIRGNPYTPDGNCLSKSKRLLCRFCYQPKTYEHKNCIEKHEKTDTMQA